MSISSEQLVVSDVHGAFLILRRSSEDDRGWFSRLLDAEDFLPEHPKFDVVNINNSFSKYKGTFRGLHWQVGEAAEAKLVRCVRGAVLDVIVDVRSQSKTYGQAALLELDADSGQLAYVPRGCAHGVLSLTDNSEIIYASDRPYIASDERGMRWNDPFPALDLPVIPAFVSEKDQCWPDYAPLITK